MTGTTERLSRSTVPAARPPELLGPIDPPESVGIVHLGLGAFTRAHQMQYTERAAEITGDRTWGILGVTGRRPDVADALAPQGGLYGMLVRSQHGDRLQLTGSIIDVASAQETDRVVAAIAASTTRIVTLTITEKAYSIDPLSTPLALLCTGLQRRFEAGGAPITIVSCDNVPGNGRVLESLVTARAGDEPFAGWLASSVRFPSTMVDRIVPATTDDDRDTAERISGGIDAGLVVAEPVTQWVIEDDFAADRPRWELAGAMFTRDVAPYEAAKLRLLNGTHSLLAYGGALAGYGTIAEAVADAGLAERARRLQADARSTLVAPEGIDLEAYSEEILQRFANPALRHTTRQVAMDGSQKLPGRIVGTVVDALSAGWMPAGAVFGVAAWIGYVARTVAHDPAALDDPMADRLRVVVSAADKNPEVLVRSFLAIEPIFPRAAAEHAALAAAVTTQVRDIQEM